MSRVWIRDYALYLPKTVMTYRQIARAMKLPQRVVKEKQGILSKPIERKLSTVDMSVASMKVLAERNKKEADMAEFVVYAGSDLKDRYIWTAGPKVAWEGLGKKILGFDVSCQCVGSLVALDFAKAKLGASGSRPASCFVTVPTKQSMIVNYDDPKVAFLDDSADGAVSVLLTNEEMGAGGKYMVLESSFISDGRFSDAVYAPFGERYTSVEKKKWEYRVLLNETAEWRDEFQKASMANFRQVVVDSLSKSGYGLGDIDYLAILHLKRSFHKEILADLGVVEDKTIYLEMYGHMQGVDPFLSLDLAERRGMVKKGDVVVMVSAGTGWTWGATTAVADRVG